MCIQWLSKYNLRLIPCFSNYEFRVAPKICGTMNHQLAYQTRHLTYCP